VQPVSTFFTIIYRLVTLEMADNETISFTRFNITPLGLARDATDCFQLVLTINLYVSIQ